jgi:hypothetical protein
VLSLVISFGNNKSLSLANQQTIGNGIRCFQGFPGFSTAYRWISSSFSGNRGSSIYSVGLRYKRQSDKFSQTKPNCHICAMFGKSSTQP